LPQESAATIIRVREAAEIRSEIACDAIVVRQPVIEKCVVRGPQVQSIVIFPKLIREKHSRFRLEISTQGLIDVLGILEQVHRCPAFEERSDQTLGLWILQHSPDLPVDLLRIL